MALSLFHGHIESFSELRQTGGQLCKHKARRLSEIFNRTGDQSQRFSNKNENALGDPAFR
jgi:hypothetical protein